MKNVLIALDYDPTAQVIAETGYKLAKQLQATVTFLHVVANDVYYSTRAYSPIMGFTGFTSAEPAELSDNRHLIEAAHNYLSQSRAHIGDPSVNIIVKEGDFATTILEVADEIKADILVLGSHSKRWLEKVIMGSVTEQVLKSAKIPLLIIPTRKEDQD